MNLLAVLTAAEYVRPKAPDSLPWFEPSVTTEVGPRLYRLVVSIYLTESISPRGSDECFHLCQDDMFPARLCWGRDGHYLARELTRDQAELLSVL